MAADVLIFENEFTMILLFGNGIREDTFFGQRQTRLKMKKPLLEKRQITTTRSHILPADLVQSDFRNLFTAYRLRYNLFQLCIIMQST